MSNSPTLEKTSGTTDAQIPITRLPVTSGTSHSSLGHVWIPKPVEDMYVEAYHAFVPKGTLEEEEAEEREWDSIVSKPHVRQALRRMAEEARQQYYAGETEEGGFGLE